jgi:hypothetical protein
MKILHFAPDEKFIPLQQELFEEAFPGANAWRILCEPGKTFRYGIAPQNVKRVSPYYFYSRELRRESEDFDLLVVHAMTPSHAAGVKTVSSDMCVLWIGWGYDYYHLLANQLDGILLEHTACLHQRLTKDNGHMGKLTISRILDGVMRILHSTLSGQGLARRESLVTVADRIDAYRVSEAEVEMLSKALPQLRADFCVHHYYTTEDVYEKGPAEMEGPNVLLGNSATATNNHIEAFELLHKVGVDARKIIVPLNTGDPIYADEICKIGISILGDSFTPLRTWLPIEEYNQKISNCGFVVMNHKRQQAFGNMNVALYKGAKVFMRPESPLYNFYQTMGVSVSSVAELEDKGVEALQPLAIDKRSHNRAIIGEYMSRKNTIANIRALESFVIKKRNALRR